MRLRRWGIAVALGAMIAAGAARLIYVHNDGARRTRASYTKYEHRIPMRDGVTLFTQVYLPKESTRAYPFLVQRTPFGVSPYGSDHYRSQLGPSPEFDHSGYIYVFQDVRGRFQSGTTGASAAT